MQPPLQPIDLTTLVALLVALPGFAAVVAALVNIGKAVGLVKDGYAAIWATGLNLLGLVALFVATLVVPDFDILTADTLLGQLAQLGGLVLSIVLQLATPRVTHEQALKPSQVPLLSTSHSG